MVLQKGGTATGVVSGKYEALTMKTREVRVAHACLRFGHRFERRFAYDLRIILNFLTRSA